MSVSQLVGSAGRAEGPGNDAIPRGSQEAPLEKHLREQGWKSVRDTGNNQGSSGNLIYYNTHTHTSWTKHEGKLDEATLKAGCPRGGSGLAISAGSLSRPQSGRPGSPSPQPHVAALLPNLDASPWGLESLGKEPSVQPCVSASG